MPGRIRIRARGRRQPKRDGSLNKTEASYAAVLEVRKRRGEIAWYSFQPMKLRLADKTTYTPDFGVMLQDGLFELHEVKGHWEDDARVKIKVAAELYWMFQFVAISKSSGGWKFEEF